MVQGKHRRFSIVAGLKSNNIGHQLFRTESLVACADELRKFSPAFSILLLRRTKMKTSSIKPLLGFLLIAISGQAYSANDEVGGSGTVNNTVVTDNTLWTTLRTVNHTVNGGVGTNDCMVVASADVSNPSPSTGKQYLFTITRNNTGNGATPLAENGSAEKTLEFVDNTGVDDPNRKPVSTNVVFTGLTSTNGTVGTNLHTFYLLGKKKSVHPDGSTTAPDLTVEDSRVDFVCVDRD
jgi:hypothetical protein